MTKAPPTPKGFRDILPGLAKKRRDIINKIVGVLEESGFVPVETPTIEFAETLKGKYGEEERLIYEFKDRGGRELALRYDLTVPLARFVASNLNLIAKGPFRRYQIGQVFRGEKPQRGRYREFTQLDFDSVGSESTEEDAKIIAAAIKSIRQLGFNNAIMAINDRRIFAGVETKWMILIDKLPKIGEEAFKKEVMTWGRSKKEAEEFLKDLMSSPRTPELNQLFSYLRKFGLEEEKDYKFQRTIVRGLNYYTSFIFELLDPVYPGLSLGGGGRYDNLVGMFAKRQIPAVGFSFGLDRLIDSLPDEIKQ